MGDEKLIKLVHDNIEGKMGDEKLIKLVHDNIEGKMGDEKLIELVHDNIELYDLTHPKYMDNNFKQDIWNKIGSEMKADSSSCKARWNNIRDCYRKYLKKTNATKNGQSSKRIKIYKYSDQLTFLNIYFEDRATKGSIEFQEGEEDRQYETVEVTWEPTISDSENLKREPSPSPNRQLPSPRVRKRKRTVTPKTASSTLMEHLVRKNVNQVDESLQLDPIDAFLAGVAPTLKSFSPYYRHMAKSEIFATVQKYEMKTLMEQHLDQRKSDPNFIHMASLSKPSSSSVSSTQLPSPVITFQENSYLD